MVYVILANSTWDNETYIFGVYSSLKKATLALRNAGYQLPEGGNWSDTFEHEDGWAFIEEHKTDIWYL